MKAAAVQISPDPTSAEGTVDRVCRAITDAAAQGVEIAVFPETFVPYYPYFSFVEPPSSAGPQHLRLYENAVSIPGWVPDVFSLPAVPNCIPPAIGIRDNSNPGPCCWWALGSPAARSPRTCT